MLKYFITIKYYCFEYYNNGVFHFANHFRIFTFIHFRIFQCSYLAPRSTLTAFSASAMAFSGVFLL